MNIPTAIDRMNAKRDAVNDWFSNDRARELLAQIDAAERMADHWDDWPEVAKAFTERADDLEGELDNIRCDAVSDAMTALGHPYASEAWDEAWDMIDSDAPPVSQVLRDARSRRLGDDFLKWRAAA